MQLWISVRLCSTGPQQSPVELHSVINGSQRVVTVVVVAVAVVAVMAVVAGRLCSNGPNSGSDSSSRASCSHTSVDIDICIGQHSSRAIKPVFACVAQLCAEAS